MSITPLYSLWCINLMDFMASAYYADTCGHEAADEVDQAVLYRQPYFYYQVVTADGNVYRISDYHSD